MYAGKQMQLWPVRLLNIPEKQLPGFDLLHLFSNNRSAKQKGGNLTFIPVKVHTLLICILKNREVISVMVDFSQ